LRKHVRLQENQAFTLLSCLGIEIYLALLLLDTENLAKMRLFSALALLASSASAIVLDYVTFLAVGQMTSVSYGSVYAGGPSQNTLLCTFAPMGVFSNTSAAPLWLEVVSYETVGTNPQYDTNLQSQWYTIGPVPSGNVTIASCSASENSNQICNVAVSIGRAPGLDVSTQVFGAAVACYVNSS
jgi:hypothetical protein